MTPENDLPSVHMGRGSSISETVLAAPRSDIDRRIADLTVPALLPVPEAPGEARQVLCDVDSTVFELLKAMSLQPGGERVDIAACHDWDALPDMCGGVPEMLELFDKAMTLESMREVGLFPGAASANRCMYAHGVRVHFATIRHPRLGPDTEHFLRECGLRFESFHCDLKLDKVALCKELGIETMLDDQPETLEAAHAAGIAPLALRHPYNDQTLRDLGTHHAGDDWFTLTVETLETVASLERRGSRDT